MNLLNFFSEKIIRLDTYTTKDKDISTTLFKASNIKIFRFGFQYKHQPALYRYCSYLSFNLFTFCCLIFKKSKAILYYETLSVLPVFFYKALFPSTKIFIHYHEYTSPQERLTSSLYEKLLMKLEKRLYPKADWISQTNKDRLSLFKNDFNNINFRDLHVMPNYPPQEWYKNNSIKNYIYSPIKFVYVGALGLETMYIKEFAEWIKKLNGKATWDIYSANYSSSVLNYLNNLNCADICFKGRVNYYDLPKTLREYDIGIILYNGHIPNYIFNAPNKLFEYQACGLDVWFSEDLKSSLTYANCESYPKIIPINFTRINEIDIELMISRAGKKEVKQQFTNNNSYELLLKQLTSKAKSVVQ